MSNINFALTEQDARMLRDIIQIEVTGYISAGFMNDRAKALVRLELNLRTLLQAHVKETIHV